MAKIYETPPKTPEDPEKYLWMAAQALKNRDRFEAATVMDLAEQAIGAYLADTAQKKAAADDKRPMINCVQCGQKTDSPIMIKVPIGHTGSWARMPYCPDCEKGLHPKDPDGGVRQG